MTELIIFITGVGSLVAIWSVFSKRKRSPIYDDRNEKYYQPLKTKNEIEEMTPEQRVELIDKLDKKLMVYDERERSLIRALNEIDSE